VPSHAAGRLEKAFGWSKSAGPRVGMLQGPTPDCLCQTLHNCVSLGRYKEGKIAALLLKMYIILIICMVTQHSLPKS